MSKTALITGGSSGIGLALTESLVSAGWRVYIVGRNKQKLDAVQQRFPEQVFPIQADLEDLDAAQTIAQHIDAPRLDALVHNAAIIDPMSSIKTVDPIAFERAQRINVTACLALTQSLLSKLDGGRVLFISSGAALFALHDWAAYCVSKAALRMLKMCFQQEVESIAFSDVKPGIVETDMTAHVTDAGGAGSEHFSALRARGGMVKPPVVAQFLNWLLTTVDGEQYQNTEWDIYNTAHHAAWLQSGEVPPLD